MIGIDATSVSAANSTATWMPVNSAVRRGRTAPFSVRIEGLRVSMRLNGKYQKRFVQRGAGRTGIKVNDRTKPPCRPIQVTHFSPGRNSEFHFGADNFATAPGQMNECL